MRLWKIFFSADKLVLLKPAILIRYTFDVFRQVNFYKYFANLRLNVSVAHQNIIGNLEDLLAKTQCTEIANEKNCQVSNYPLSPQ